MNGSLGLVSSSNGSTLPSPTFSDPAGRRSGEWSPGQQQTTVVATLLWNVGGVGFVLNALLLFRYARSRWSLLPLPPPAVVVNLCVSNMLLVVTVLLATLNLTIELGDSGDKAGSLQLFLAVFVLIQSWLGHVMLAWCGLWLSLNPALQRKKASSYNVEMNMAAKAGARPAPEPSMDGRRRSRPCRRHRHYQSYTTSRRAPSSSGTTIGPRRTFTPAEHYVNRSANCSHEAARRGGSKSPGRATTQQSLRASPYPPCELHGVTLSVRQRCKMKCWLLWAWLLSLLAAVALLMTNMDDKDACSTLDPFRRQYSLAAGDFVSTAEVREDSSLRVPLLLVLVPVYVLGTVFVIKVIVQRLLTRRKQHLSRSDGRKPTDKRVGDKSALDTRSRFRSIPAGNLKKCLRGKKRDEQAAVVEIKNRGDKSVCNINMNAMENANVCTSAEDSEKDKRNVDECFKEIGTGCNALQTGRTQERQQAEKPSENLHLSSLSPCPHEVSHLSRPLDTPVYFTKRNSSKVKEKVTATKEELHTSRLSSDERDAASLPFIDEDMSNNDMSQNCSETKQKEKQKFDDNLDLTLFETDDYVIHFRDSDLGQYKKDVLGGPDDEYFEDVSPARAQSEDEKEEDALHQAHHTLVGRNVIHKVESTSIAVGDAGVESRVDIEFDYLDTDQHQGNVSSDSAPRMTSNANNSANKGNVARSREGGDTGDRQWIGNRFKARNPNVGFSAFTSRKRSSKEPTPSFFHLASYELPGTAECVVGKKHRSLDSCYECYGTDNGSRGDGRGRAAGMMKIVSSSMHHFTVQGRPQPVCYLDCQSCDQKTPTDVELNQHDGHHHHHHHHHLQHQPQRICRQGMRRPRRSNSLASHRRQVPWSPDASHYREPHDLPWRDKMQPKHMEPTRTENSDMSVDLAAAEQFERWRDPPSKLHLKMDRPTRQWRECGHQEQPWTVANVRRQQSDLSLPWQPLSGKDVSETVGWGDTTAPTLSPSPRMAEGGGEGGNSKAVDGGRGRHQTSTSCQRGDCGATYDVKCLLGLALHVLLCLPFAASLLPGLWHGVDCITRLHALLVLRILFFSHAIIGPLWLLSFHGSQLLLQSA